MTRSWYKGYVLSETGAAIAVKANSKKDARKRIARAAWDLTQFACIEEIPIDEPDSENGLPRLHNLFWVYRVDVNRRTGQPHDAEPAIYDKVGEGCDPWGNTEDYDGGPSLRRLVHDGMYFLKGKAKRESSYWYLTGLSTVSGDDGKRPFPNSKESYYYDSLYT
jgi:hypothetical protein